MRPDQQTPSQPRAARRSILFIGGCQVEGLIAPLGTDFDCQLLWRRPTIPLMSCPLAIAAPLAFKDRQARYIVRDCAKSHLAEIRSMACDVLVFEIMRDIRTPLVRSGDAHIFDPNGMFNLVPDARPEHERAVDVQHLLGDAKAERLDALDPSFLPLWERSFRAFHSTVLSPILARGGIVVLQRCFLAKQTLPPSDALSAYWEYCDSANALLRRMYAVAETCPGIRTFGLEEHQCVTAADAAWGGIAITHLIPDAFAIMADQLRAVIGLSDVPLGEATSAQLLRRAAEYHRLSADRDAERHALNLEILSLKQTLARERATRDREKRRNPLNRVRNLFRSIFAAAARRRDPT